MSINIKDLSLEDTILETVSLQKKFFIGFNPANLLIWTYKTWNLILEEQIKELEKEQQLREKERQKKNWFENVIDDVISAFSGENPLTDVIVDYSQNVGYEINILKTIDSINFKNYIRETVSGLNNVFSQIDKNLVVANPQVVENQFYQVWENGFSKAYRELSQLGQKAQKLVQLIENDPNSVGLEDGARGFLLGFAMGPLGVALEGINSYKRYKKSKEHQSILDISFDEFEYWATKFYEERLLQIHKDIATITESYAEQLKRQMLTLVDTLNDTQKEHLRNELQAYLSFGYNELASPLDEETENSLTFNDIYEFGAELLRVSVDNT